MTNKYPKSKIQNPKFFLRGYFVALAIIFLAASCNPFNKAGVAGVVRSNNGGADWTAANVIKDSQSTLVALNVAKMAFDPKNREIVFASGYNDGLYKSEDSGGSWRRILSKIWAYDFTVHPFDSNVIFAAGYFGDRGYVVKTQDGGKSWEDIYTEAASVVSVRSLALNLSQPNQMIIGNSAGRVIKSNDGGLSWKLVKDFDDRVNRVFWQNGQVYVLTRTKGLFKSSNLEAGEFVELTESLTKLPDFSSNFTGLSEQSFNQAFIDKISPNLIYLTAGKGLFKTTDEGKEWQKLELPGKQTSELPARAVAVAETSSNILFVSVGSVIYKSTDGGQTFQTQNVPTSGFVTYILVDPQLPQIVYAGNFLSQ